MPLSKIVVPDGGIKTARKEKKDNIALSENQKDNFMNTLKKTN